MTAQPITSQRLADLRRRAASLLTGVGGAKGEAFSSADALAVLHDLAASPDTAADALALLHELQVYQVEVDLQAEALSESHAELESALRRQNELYDALPVGCFTIDRDLVVHRLNLTACHMLGTGRDEVIGLAMDTFLAPECGRALRQWVENIAEGRAGAPPTVQLIPKGGMARPVRAHVGADPAGPHFLLVLADAGDAAAGVGS